MRKEVDYVRSYFAQFRYEPEPEELYTYLPRKMARNSFISWLRRLKNYTPQGYGSLARSHRKRKNLSLKKIQRLTYFFDRVAEIGCVRYVGLSGSVALLHASAMDDIDLFVITQRNRLWSVRAATNILALICGVKRSRTARQAQDKVCLNLFFAEDELSIAPGRRTEYMAHEVLQTVPIIDVNNTYRRFIRANSWVTAFFPNVHVRSYEPVKRRYVSYSRSLHRTNTPRFLGNVLEAILRHVQLLYMRSARGDERINAKQLWFHPRDYQKQVRRAVFKI